MCAGVHTRKWNSPLTRYTCWSTSFCMQMMDVCVVDSPVILQTIVMTQVLPIHNNNNCSSNKNTRYKSNIEIGVTIFLHDNRHVRVRNAFVWLLLGVQGADAKVIVSKIASRAHIWKAFRWTSLKLQVGDKHLLVQISVQM
jgi:hypothetical protein